GVPPPWTAAEFTTRYVPTLQSLEALRDGYLSVSLPMIEQLIEDGRRGVPPPWTAAEFTTRYVPTLQSLEALRDGYLSVS
ncbi:hypothetical protein C7E25_24115, partial [Stenotrophomonas maltophilia]